MKRRSKTFIAESFIMSSFSKAVEKVSRQCGLDLDLKDLYAWKEQIRNFEMVVMGMYNAGKSTLLNLLLDLGNGLPTGIRPTTNKLWKISYSSRPQLKAMRFNSSKAEFVIVKKLSSILEDIESKYSADEFSLIDYYELGLPSEWLRRTGWAIWDTPGKDDLDGLLNEDHFGRVLESAKGAMVVTNYDQYKSCSEYLLQLKSKQIECVVIALTNSAARTPDEFTAAADRHLEQVTGYLRGFFPSARFDFAIDSKDPSGSKDSMQNRWLKSLWSIVAGIEKIEESLILLRAWKSLEPAVSAAMQQLDLRISQLREEATLMGQQIAEMQAKVKLPIASEALRKLDTKIATELKERIRSKSENIRKEGAEEMQAAKEACEPSFAEKAFKIFTFGQGGRDEGEIDRDFANDFKSRMMNLGQNFIREKVWKYIMPKVQRSGLELANIAAQNYIASAGTKHRFSYCPDLKNESIDALNDFALEKFDDLEKNFSKRGFRNNGALQEQFLDQVKSTSEAIFLEAIRHAVRIMIADINADHQRFRERVCKGLENKIAKQKMAMAETEESILQITDAVNFLNQLKSQLESALDRHQQTINKHHHR